MTNELQSVGTYQPTAFTTSRFISNYVYRLADGTTFLQTWNAPNILVKSTDTTLVVDYRLAFRPDLISDKMYNTPLLAWAICVANNIMNPLDRKTGLYVGRIIRIPDPSTLYGLSS